MGSTIRPIYDTRNMILSINNRYKITSKRDLGGKSSK